MLPFLQIIVLKLITIEVTPYFNQKLQEKASGYLTYYNSASQLLGFYRAQTITIPNVVLPETLLETQDFRPQQRSTESESEF